MKSDRAIVSGIARERFPCVNASWREYIWGVVYVPLAAERHLATLKHEGGKAFLGELEKLAAMGSPWAAAFLGYQALLLRPDGTRDIEKAIQVCRQPAAAGDAYASYILGWATFLRGDHAEAIKHFRVANRQMFPPSVLDQVRLFWMVRSRTHPTQVLVSLKHAKNVGHRETIVLRSAIYRTGKLGVGRLLLGYLLAPCAWVYIRVASFREPFSAQSFSFHSKIPARALRLRELGSGYRLLPSNKRWRGP
jgi:hypothetical protein